jgi:tetratricopeptide (TPR) repeat protein
MSTLGDAVRHGWAQADPARPEDTVRYFDDLLRRHPGQAGALLGYAGALDYADREAEAAGFYQQAIAAGLDPDEHRQALIQYGSTLRNLGRHQEAVSALRQARQQYPADEAAVVFLALALTSAGQAGEAVAALVTLAVDRIDSDSLRHYQRALRHYAATLAQ